MAGVIVHLAIADSTFKKLKIKNLPEYYIGSIAPDCIHARSNYQREMKKHTHLRDGIRDWEFVLNENQKLFYERMDEFVSRYCKTQENYDLYKGYLAHLITDERFMKTIRLECADEAEKSGIAQTDKRFFDFMMGEVNGMDSIVAKRFEFINNPSMIITGRLGYYIKDYIYPEEITESINWINYNFFSGKESFPPPAYLTFGRIMEFIEEASDEIYNRFCKYSLI